MSWCEGGDHHMVGKRKRCSQCGSLSCSEHSWHTGPREWECKPACRKAVGPPGREP